MNQASKGRAAWLAAVGVLMMMAVVGVAQYLVSGKISTGVMVAVGVPTGILLGTSLAKGQKA